jgi:hypothetical protein
MGDFDASHRITMKAGRQQAAVADALGGRPSVQTFLTARNDGTGSTDPGRGKK